MAGKQSKDTGPDVSALLNELGSAVGDAKAKKQTVEAYKAELAALIAEKQVAIDTAQQAYDDAKVAADRLQAAVRDLIGELLPAPDPRYRVTT